MERPCCLLRRRSIPGIQQLLCAVIGRYDGNPTLMALRTCHRQVTTKTGPSRVPSFWNPSTHMQVTRRSAPDVLRAVFRSIAVLQFTKGKGQTGEV